MTDIKIEEISEYIETLAFVSQLSTEIKSLTEELTDAIHPLKLPFKNEDLEMEMSSIIIRNSTIAANADRLKDNVKKSAEIIKKKLATTPTKRGQPAKVESDSEKDMTSDSKEESKQQPK